MLHCDRMTIDELSSDLDARLRENLAANSAASERKKELNLCTSRVCDVNVGGLGNKYTAEKISFDYD